MKTSVWLAAVGYLDLRALVVAVLWWKWRLMKSWIKQLQLMVCSPFKLIAEYPHSPNNSSTAHSKQWQPLIIGSQTLDHQCRALSVISSLEVLAYNSGFRFYKWMTIRPSGWQSIGVLVRQGIITVDRSLSVCGGRGLNVVWNMPRQYPGLPWCTNLAANWLWALDNSWMNTAAVWNCRSRSKMTTPQPWRSCHLLVICDCHCRTVWHLVEYKKFCDNVSMSSLFYLYCKLSFSVGSLTQIS